MKKGFILASLFICFGVLSFRPVPAHVPEDQLLTHTGIVKHLSVAGTHDVLIAFENSPITFYVNRALEKGIVFDAIQEELIGNAVTVKYPKHWSLLDPKGQHKSTSIIEVSGQRIFPF